MTRVLFLDFDGVLHPVGTKPGESLPFEWLPELTALLSIAPDVAVAVHSSWAEHYSISELTEFLEPIATRFVGTVGPGPRATAIETFLRSRPELNDWLVLDDDQREFPRDFPGTVVLCDPKRGITDPIAQDKVRRWLCAAPETRDLRGWPP